MHRTGGADSTTSKPTLSGSLANNTYHTNGPPGTIVDAYWANAVQEELAAVVEEFGTLDATGDVHTQVRDALYGAYGVISDSTDTGVDSTSTARVLLAAQSCQATGNTSAVIASGNSITAGLRSAVVASFEAQTTSTALYSFIAGCQSNDEANLYINGDRAAIIACQAASGEAQGIGTNGTSVAIIASAAGPNLIAVTSSTEACAIIASKSAAIDNATACAIIASGYNPAGTTADRPDIGSGADFSAFIACDGDATITGNNCLAVGSSFGNTGVTISDNDALVMYSGTSETIKLDAVTGEVKCDALRVDDAPVAAGTGAATLAKIPGTSSGDNIWIPISISGTTYYMAVWN